MNTKRSLSIPFIIIAVILGSALYKQFDFQTQSFKQPALSLIYGISFIFAVFIVVKDFVKPPQK
ncbi:hypothetical protein [Flavobacterium sp. 25HG05S-40]|uniref:hypothetical protein n=1 Tax=Flavobacterium sp. 25HG05S-40 TaxID=3458682 RepID=UPI004043E06B